MPGDFFEAWFEEHLFPELPGDVTIILDNAPFHRKKRLYEIAQRHKRKIIFLPPYSTELNPIEHFWHWLKKTTADCLKFCSNLNIAISEALQKWIIKFMFFKCFDYNTPVLVWLQIGYFIIQVCFRLKDYLSVFPSDTGSFLHNKWSIWYKYFYIGMSKIDG